MFFKQTKVASHLSETLRRAGVCMMTILCAMLLTVTTWAQSLENGTYTIANNVSHDNPVGEGMARSYTEAISDVEVNDNGTYVSLEFNNTQFMGNFTITVDGSNVSYETTTLANNMKKLKFKVPSLSSSIQVGLYVTAMDTNVVYTVTLNEGSLELIKKAETAPVVQESNKAESIEASKPAKQPVASTVKQDHSTSKNQVVTEKPAISAQKVETTKSEVAKVEAKAETKVEATQTETAKEAAKAEQKVTIEETAKAESEEAIKTEEAKAEEKTEAQEKAEETAQTEVKEDVAENIQSTEGQDTETVSEPSETATLANNEAANLENNEAATSSNSLSMPLVIGGSILVAIIAGVIYLKRK